MNMLKDYIEEEVERQIELLDIPKLNRNIVNQYINENYSGSLLEMARINTKEFYGYFPCNKFEIKIWSRDHNPPHFHVITDDWDIVVSIIDGRIIRTKMVGKDSKIYSYVEKNIQKWLQSPSSRNSKLTNFEHAMMVWEDENPDVDDNGDT